MSFDWIVDGELAAMAMPWPREVERLPAHGIGRLVSLTLRPPQGLPFEGVELLHLPVLDFHPPSLRQLAQAVTFIDAAVAAGRAAAVHCGAGLGRTGTVCAAWLVARGMDPEEAITTVRSRRPGSVETRAQVAIVHEFAAARGSGAAT